MIPNGLKTIQKMWVKTNVCLQRNLVLKTLEREKIQEISINLLNNLNKNQSINELIKLKNQSINKLIKFFCLLFKSSFCSWCIPLHHVKYEDSTIKCLEMKAKIKPGKKINKIFLCILPYI